MVGKRLGSGEQIAAIGLQGTCKRLRIRQPLLTPLQKSSPHTTTDSKKLEKHTRIGKDIIKWPVNPPTHNTQYPPSSASSCPSLCFLCQDILDILQHLPPVFTVVYWSC